MRGEAPAPIPHCRFPKGLPGASAASRAVVLGERTGQCAGVEDGIVEVWKVPWVTRIMSEPQYSTSRELYIREG